MSVTTQITPRGHTSDPPCYDLVPRWHVEWIAEYAHRLALQAYLHVAGFGDASSLPSHVWEIPGLEILHNVFVGLDGLENPEAVRAAQFFGAETYLRSFFCLLNSGGCGGRA